jgi:hypothetical protein
MCDRGQDGHADALRDLLHAKVVARVGHGDDEIAFLDTER